MRYLACLLITILAGAAGAVETPEVRLQHGESADATVTVSRDALGHLVFADQHTSPTTLSQLAALPDDHGALDGLSDDDHAHYHNAARHAAAHDAPFNGALPIQGDVGGNATLGAHVADAGIHLRTDAAAAVSGAWDFTTALLVRGGVLRLGVSQYGSQPAIRFEDAPVDAELLYDGVNARFAFDRTAQAPRFQTGSLRLTGIPAVRLAVLNSGGGAITTGAAVRWEAAGADYLAVSALDAATTTTTPFAGIALADAAAGAGLDIAIGGFAQALAAGPISAGDMVTWTGSAVEAGTPAIGRAMEAHSDGGWVLVQVLPSAGE